MYYLPKGPYHNNLSVYWRTNQQHLGNDFWRWVKNEYNARLALWERPERWFFESEKDMIWFMLRWS